MKTYFYRTEHLICFEREEKHECGEFVMVCDVTHHSINKRVCMGKVESVKTRSHQA